MLPKPNKDNYNEAKSYRPITLGSVVGKLMEKIIKLRLTWKLESENVFSNTQYAYRKNRSCTQAVLKMVNNIQENLGKSENTVLVTMDFESCFERVWREGLLKKAEENNIRGRLWIYLKELMSDRKYYLKINDFKSPVMTSKIGIPQGSVLSPTLCNLYTSDCITNVLCQHIEFADDACLYNSDTDINKAIQSTNTELEKINQWCTKWNMSIAPEKTTVLLVGKELQSMDKPKFNSNELKIVKNKRILGITLDSLLNFETHIEEKTTKGFNALHSLDKFVDYNHGCSQSTYMKLYKSLVLPIMDYGASVLATATDKATQQFGTVQRSAMLKASGCISSTSTETMEILTNTIPINIHLKLRQAEEMVRIAAKREENDTLKQDFNRWLANPEQHCNKPTLYSILMSRFIEHKVNVQFKCIEKEFEYKKEYMGLSRTNQKVYTENFKLNKDHQMENVNEILNRCSNNEIIIFTDGSTIGNPGPTGAGAVIYLNGYMCSPILLKQGVAKISNNYTGELVGIEIGLNFVDDLQDITNRKIIIFTDCQAAITTAFACEIPTRNIEIILNIKLKLKLRRLN